MVSHPAPPRLLPMLALIAAQLGVAPMQAQHNPKAFAIVRRAVDELDGEPGGMDTEIRPGAGRLERMVALPSGGNAGS